MSEKSGLFDRLVRVMDYGYSVFFGLVLVGSLLASNPSTKGAGVIVLLVGGGGAFVWMGAYFILAKLGRMKGAYFSSALNDLED